VNGSIGHIEGKENLRGPKELDQGKRKRFLLNFVNLLVSAILLIVVVCVFVPFLPNMPSDGLDPSWQLGMSQAINQGLAIGKELIFTFGPYASLYTNSFHPATDEMIMLSGLYLAITYFYALYLMSKKGNWHVKVMLCLLFGGILYLRDPLFFSYPLILGFLVLKSSGHKSETDSILIEAVLFFPLGLLPLIKSSNLILSFGVVILTTIFFIIHNKFRSAAVAFLTPIFSLCIFWFLAGQPIFNLFSYFKASQEIISGYSEAMALIGPSYEIYLYLCCATLMLCHALFITKFNFINKLYLFLLLFLYLFVAFKAGFVRHDGHAMIAGISLLLAAIVYLFLGCDRYSLAILFFSFFVWVVIDANYAHTTMSGYAANLKNTYVNSFVGAKDRLINGDNLRKVFNGRLHEIAKKINIPLSDGTSDIYSHGQSYLIASGNTWNPRPIFQSYSAYTPYLINKNVNHISGSKAPDNIFFGIEPIDRKVPTIEDGLSWPILFSRYMPKEIQGQLIHLIKKDKDDTKSNNLTISSTHLVSFGENILVPQSKDLIFVRIDIKKTIFGILRNLVYKSTPLEITLNFEEGGSRVYKIHPGMASSGFLMSPLVENITDFADLYADQMTSSYKYIKSFNIKPVGARFEWNDSYRVEFSQVQQPQKSHNLYLSDLDALLLPLSNKQPNVSDDCIGAIDAINELAPSSQILVRNGSLSVRGWLAKTSGVGSQPRPAILILSKKEGGLRAQYLKTRVVHRPDVGLATGISALDNSGFEVAIDVAKISGNYQIGLGFIDDGILKLCPQFHASASFNGIK